MIAQEYELVADRLKGCLLQTELPSNPRLKEAYRANFAMSEASGKRGLVRLMTLDAIIQTINAASYLQDERSRCEDALKVKAEIGRLPTLPETIALSSVINGRSGLSAAAAFSQATDQVCTAFDSGRIKPPEAALLRRDVGSKVTPALIAGYSYFLAGYNGRPELASDIALAITEVAVVKYPTTRFTSEALWWVTKFKERLPAGFEPYFRLPGFRAGAVVWGNKDFNVTTDYLPGAAKGEGSRRFLVKPVDDANGSRMKEVCDLFRYYLYVDLGLSVDTMGQRFAISIPFTQENWLSLSTGVILPEYCSAFPTPRRLTEMKQSKEMKYSIYNEAFV